MRIFCSICKEIFIPYSEINATTCGHLYHGTCISRWLKQHKTCPQCRASLKSQLIRIYFDVDKDTGEDASTLEHKLETVTSQLHQSEDTNRILREKNEKVEKIMSEVEEKSTKLKQKNHVLKSSVQALKDQIIKLNKQNEAAQELKRELEDSKKKLLCYEKLDFILNSTAEEADKLLKSTPVTEFGVKQLSIYTSALKDKTEQDKKKLESLTREKKELQKALESEQMRNSNGTQGEYKKLKVAYDSLEKEFSIAKDLLGQCSLKSGAKSTVDIVIGSKSQVSSKRPLFHINIDVADTKSKKIKKTNTNTSDVSDSLKQWEDLVSAGPSRHAGLLPGKSHLGRTTSSDFQQNKNFESSMVNYAFDGMGGRKKICLAHPTPRDEFLKIKALKVRKGS